MRSSDTVFISPDYDIDNRLYFSDISINKESMMNEYQSLLSQGRFDDALDLIQDEDFYGAWLLNLLENRLHNLYIYIDGLDKPVLETYQIGEPSGVSVGMVWIDKPATGNVYPSSTTYPSNNLFPS